MTNIRNEIPVITKDCRKYYYSNTKTKDSTQKKTIHQYLSYPYLNKILANKI